MQPEGAGLNLRVDFYGRGKYPPHTLHSEGHQDSMGLCLYLALNEEIAGKYVDLIVLDDVMMSINLGHRRQFSHLLKTDFPGQQFLITTHDSTWARQLRTDGVVTRDNLIELAGWTVNKGPRVTLGADVWRFVEEALGRDNVKSAAVHLRNGMEEYYSYVCSDLGAQTTHKLDCRWDLGELMHPAFPRYKDLGNGEEVRQFVWK